MALSLADELGDELDAELSNPAQGTGLGLGQSLADELDLGVDSDNGIQATSAARLRDDGLPLPRPEPTPTCRQPKTSTTSTYYTATASPGRFSLPDSADEVSQDFLELQLNDEGDDRHGYDDPFAALHLDAGEEDMGISMDMNDAGVPSPRVGEDLLVSLQEQIEERNHFISLLRSTIDFTLAPSAISHSLNRSSKRPSIDEEGILRHHLDQLEQATRALADRNRDIAKIHQHLAQSVVSPDVLDGLLDLLANHHSSTHEPNPDTPKAVASDQSFELDPPSVTASATAVESLVHVNQDLATECAGLSESVHLHQSFLTSTSRQLKALKANVATWKDKDQAEDRARASIERWERSQVERGLRGERDTKEVLDELVDGFRRQVAECDSRVKELRQSSTSPPTVSAH